MGFENLIYGKTVLKPLHALLELGANVNAQDNVSKYAYSSPLLGWQHSPS